MQACQDAVRQWLEKEDALCLQRCRGTVAFCVCRSFASGKCMTLAHAVTGCVNAFLPQLEHHLTHVRTHKQYMGVGVSLSPCRAAVLQSSNGRFELAYCLSRGMLSACRGAVQLLPYTATS